MKIWRRSKLIKLEREKQEEKSAAPPIPPSLLQEERDLTYVTLVCEDNTTIQVHQRAAGSVTAVITVPGEAKDGLSGSINNQPGGTMVVPPLSTCGVEAIFGRGGYKSLTVP